VNGDCAGRIQNLMMLYINPKSQGTQPLLAPPMPATARPTQAHSHAGCRVWAWIWDWPQLANDDPDSALRMALQTMRSAAVHGIKDARASHDFLYIAFSTSDASGPLPCAALTQVLPYIDNALRQVAHLPHQIDSLCAAAGAIHSRYLSDRGLNQYEVDILGWIAMGKTNPEISSILEFSVFSIKNSVHRIFKKLNVSNRAQAVAALTSHA
jgi:DNA-binding CsgD family transcriptional regulator